MKSWAWILPFWVWKYFFAQFPRQRVLLDGRTPFLVRLDEEFALVYDPPSKADEPAKTPWCFSWEKTNKPTLTQFNCSDLVGSARLKI